MINIDDFRKLDIRVAKVLEASAHPNADRLLVIRTDIGGGETRQVVAGIKKCYAPEQLVGKSVIMLCNLEPAILRGVESQGMILAASYGADPKAEDFQIVVLTTEKELPAGVKVS